MSSARAFHLRRQANALQRLALQRCYTTEPTKTSHTLEEQIAFLRAQDQQALQQTQEQLDVLKDHVNKYQERLLAAAATISGPAVWDPLDEKKAQARERRGYPNRMPPYTIGHTRHQTRPSDTPKIVQNVMAVADHIGAHLTDLKYEPYRERGGGDSSTAAWEAEIAKMSRAEQEEQLFELQMKEEAAYAQLRKSGELLVERVKQIDAMTRSGKGRVDLDAPVRSAMPEFQREAEKAGSTSTATSTTTASRDSRGKAKEAESIPQPARAAASLSELQKKLEESMKR